MTLLERFWSKVDTTGDCWIWQASVTSTGYGQFVVDSRNFKAHRFAYEVAIGPIPAGLEIDHLCENVLCVNPWHLEPVSHAENIRRSSRHNGAKTHCPLGHRYSKVNTYRPGTRAAKARC